MGERLPTIFFGHGNPLLAVQPSRYGAAWAGLGARLPRPRAILCISAHWYGSGIRVTAMAAPRTIHDFGGFPPELYAVEYPAPGDPTLAAQVQALLTPASVTLDQDWGLDHGAWSVLRHLFPTADIPVVQLSLDATASPASHYALGQRLAPLRAEGVLVIGSGNLVHNLRAYAWDRPTATAADWALRFEQAARRHMLAREHGALIDYLSLDPEAKRAVPTPEHYLPLLYVLAQQEGEDPLSFPVEGIDGGSISMLAVQVG